MRRVPLEAYTITGLNGSGRNKSEAKGQKTIYISSARDILWETALITAELCWKAADIPSKYLAWVWVGSTWKAKNLYRTTSALPRTKSHDCGSSIKFPSAKTEEPSKRRDSGYDTRRHREKGRQQCIDGTWTLRWEMSGGIYSTRRQWRQVIQEEYAW